VGFILLAVLSTMLALEYCALGLLAGLIGAGGALGLSWAVTTYLLEIDWRPAPMLLTAGVILTAALVGTVGVAASVDVLRRKPLATLRAEEHCGLPIVDCGLHWGLLIGH
jgi:putative ABC transport system permease protein